MKRNDEYREDEYCEFDGYDFPDIPVNTKPLTKEEEDRLMAEVITRVKKLKAEQEAREAQRAMNSEAPDTVSISIAAPKVSAMETSR